MINADNYKHSEITEKIIKAFYKVYNSLGYGFLEKVYENALFIELVSLGFFVEKQKLIKVYYQSQEVGEYFSDLLVEECVIVELKASESISEEHEFQLINYLKATEVEVGLLLNSEGNRNLNVKFFQTEEILLNHKNHYHQHSIIYNKNADV